MGFGIFPRRTDHQRASEISDARAALVFYGAVALAGIGTFMLISFTSPANDSAWSTARWAALAVGAICLYCTLQAFFELTIAATIGYERVSPSAAQ